MLEMNSLGFQKAQESAFFIISSIIDYFLIEHFPGISASVINTIYVQRRIVLRKGTLTPKLSCLL
jgi:hypothetical protein